MRSWTLSRLGAAAIVLAALMVLVSGSLTVKADKHFSGLYGGELRVAVLEDIDLNPFGASASWEVIPLVYDSIARISADDLAPEPWAAKGWIIEGSALNVTLRDDLVFHDGSALTAADVSYSYETYRALGMVPADLTIVSDGTYATFSSATGGGLFFGVGLTLPIVKEGTGLTNAPVGSGPFEPSTTVMPVSLDANADHFAAPFLSKVTFSSYGDTAAAAEALLRGDTDFIGWALSGEETSAIIDVDGENKTLLNDATIVNSPGLTHLAVGFNTSAGGPAADLKLRLAMADALNPALYSAAYPNTIKSRGPVINENTPWFNPDVPIYQALSVIRFAGDRFSSQPFLAPSLQQLDDGGYADIDGDGVRENPDGSPLVLTMLGRPSDEDPRVFFIQSHLKSTFESIGLNVTLETVAGVDLPARLEAGGFDFFVADIDTALDPSFLRAYFHTSGNLNYFGNSSTALDDALDAADAALDVTERQAEVDTIQELTLSEVIAVPILHFDAIYATIRGEFEGWVSMPGGVNNFWTYVKLHAAQLGSLSADLALVPISATSGDDVTALVGTVDQDGVALADISVRLLAGGIEVATSTTDAAGSATMIFAAPSVAGVEDIEIVAEATTAGYVGDKAASTITVRPAIGALLVTVTSDETSIDPDESASLTVTVRDSAGAVVSGASVSLSVIGQGGSLESLGGTTGASGTYATSFSADVGVRTQFRIAATASLSGFTDGSGSTSILAEQRVGEIEPRLAPFFGWGAIIVAIVVLAVIVLYVTVRRR